MREMLENCINLPCEVRTMENDLLMPARINAVYEEYGLSVEIVSVDGADLPVMSFNMPIKLSIFNKEYGIIVIGGNLFISNPTFWRITGIEKYGIGERREFFRMRSNGRGYARPVNDTEADLIPFRLINVSLSGLLFECDARFDINEFLQIENMRISEDSQPFSFTCSVRRIDSGNPRGNFYGCSYEDLTTRESDRLCKIIFELQRESVQKSRRRL